jgi:peptidyl-prolyl cis-trans isomerase B (cyclophilin B)
MKGRNKTLSRLGIFLIFMSVFSFIVFYLVVLISNQGYSYVDLDTLELVQTEEIPEGSLTAVITTDMGEIRAVLYPEYAPETVAQFVELAESGYYDGTYVYEAKTDVYFAAGSADTQGNLPDTATQEQERVPQELHQNLWPLRGALCAVTTSVEGNFLDRVYKSEKTYTGSRFMVLGSVDFSDEEYVEEFREASGSDLLADAFVENGGVPNFSQQVTVFGQVYAGFDVISAICAGALQEETNENGYTPPVEDCRIISVTIGSYGEEDALMDER